jgi:hypothetical protein
MAQLKLDLIQILINGHYKKQITFQLRSPFFQVLVEWRVGRRGKAQSTYFTVRGQSYLSRLPKY